MSFLAPAFAAVEAEAEADALVDCWLAPVALELLEPVVVAAPEPPVVVVELDEAVAEEPEADPTGVLFAPGAQVAADGRLAL